MDPQGSSMASKIFEALYVCQGRLFSLKTNVQFSKTDPQIFKDQDYHCFICHSELRQLKSPFQAFLANFTGLPFGLQ